MAGIKLRMVYETMDTETGTRIQFHGNNLVADFFAQAEKRFAAVAGAPDLLNRCSSKPCVDSSISSEQQAVESELQLLVNHPGKDLPVIEALPDVTFLRFSDPQGGEEYAYTLVRDRFHKNVAFMLKEKGRYDPEKDRLTLVRGPLGIYPNFIFNVPKSEAPGFVSALLAAKGKKAFQKIVDAYGIRRMHPDFWDNFHFFGDYLKAHDPLEWGMFDANRYRNF
jgi:hypothetical protein